MLAIRRSLVAWLIVLGVAAPAFAGARPAPWLGGANRISPFEARASAIASSLAGQRVSVECVGPTAWRSLAAQYRFDRSLTWALTPLRPDSSTGAAESSGYSLFSPRGCRLGDAFFAAPTERGARICNHGTAAKRRAGRTTVLGECDDWGSKLVAVHVLGHESMHLAGVIEEAPADCLGAQVGAFVARRLGASAGFARSLALEYWRYYYRSQDPRYQSPDCRDGGRLDLFPDRPGWPTPDRYPSNLSAVIGRFVSGAESSGGTS